MIQYISALSSVCDPQDDMVNPTVRKDMKGSQKLYCCPIEGCPRGPNRPFSQFSLVKQVSLFSKRLLSYPCDQWYKMMIPPNFLLSTKYVPKIFFYRNYVAVSLSIN